MPGPKPPDLPQSHCPVDVPVTCVITRFGLRSQISLLALLRDNRQIVRAARAQQNIGLLRSAFLIESPRVCYSLSIWSGDPAMSASVQAHIEAANRVFGRLATSPDGTPELWSTQWRLVSTTNNLNWGDFDLRAFLEAAAS